MEVSDIVSLLDEKYVKEPVECPNEGLRIKLPQSQVIFTEHGSMGVHKSGAFLVCGICGTQTPIARP